MNTLLFEDPFEDVFTYIQEFIDVEQQYTLYTVLEWH